MPPDGGAERAAILIAGGGIAGLATALALARRGFPSHVVEQRAAFADEGAGIQIGPNGLRLLEMLGVAERLRPLAGAPDAIRVLDGASARLLAELPLGPAITARHGAPYWVAHRGDLHGALLATARRTPGIRIGMGVAAHRADFEPGRVSLATADGGRLDAPALVAADGLWSGLRTRHFDPAPPVFQGKCAARTVIPSARAPEFVAANATFAWLAPGAHVVHYPVRGGGEIAVVVIVAEPEPSRDWSREVAASWVLDRTRAFHPALRSLLAAGETWRKWSLHALPAPRRMAQGTLALVGDAAHPPLPFLAQGGVMALEDAIVLAHEVAATPEELAAAFARYARARLPRVGRVLAASRRNGEIYHLSGALAVARNAAMAALGGRRILAGYDWLYGWRPPSE